MLGALRGLSAMGAGLHIGGSVLIVTGQTIVKMGHCIEDSSSLESSWLLPKHASSTPTWRRPDGRCRRQLAGSKSYTALGWLLFAVGNIMRFVSMRFAAQTVLSGLGSLQFVLIPIAARLLLGIKSHMDTVLGVAIVLLGNVLIVSYGPPEVSFTLGQLRSQWSSKPMKVLLIVLGGMLGSLQSVWWYMTGHLRQQAPAAVKSQQHAQQVFLLSSTSVAGGEQGQEVGLADKLHMAGREQNATQVFVGALLFSAVASFIGAWSVLFSKSLTYVVTAMPESLENWYSWFVVAAFLGSAAFWVRQSDRGLRLYPASLIMPLMQAFWMCMSVVEGGIYFNELAILPANSLLLLMAGLALALAGAMFMGITGYMSEKRDAAMALGARMLMSSSSVECMDLLEAKLGSPPDVDGSWPGDHSQHRLSTPVYRLSGAGAGSKHACKLPGVDSVGSQAGLVESGLAGGLLVSQQPEQVAGGATAWLVQAGVASPLQLSAQQQQQQQQQHLPPDGTPPLRGSAGSSGLLDGLVPKQQEQVLLVRSPSSRGWARDLVGAIDGPRDYVLQAAGTRSIMQRVKQAFQ